SDDENFHRFTNIELSFGGSWRGGGGPGGGRAPGRRLRGRRHGGCGWLAAGPGDGVGGLRAFAKGCRWKGVAPSRRRAWPRVLPASPPPDGPARVRPPDRRSFGQ